jgi:hypothetical protein
MYMEVGVVLTDLHIHYCNCRLLVFTVKYQAKKAVGHVTVFVTVHDPLQVKIHWFNKLELLWFHNSHRCLMCNEVEIKITVISAFPVQAYLKQFDGD